jgi:hypothetical protein
LIAACDREMIDDGTAGHQNAKLFCAVALDRGMNLAPVQVEHAHGDGARRPVYFTDKRDRPNSVPRIRK